MIYYIYDNNEVVGLKYKDQTYFYKKNLQGDIIGLYNSNYEQIVTYTYDSWGQVLSVSDNNGNEITDNNHIGIINPFRYRSYYYDEETKLYYLNSRYYNPLWGRFINSDSVIIFNKDSLLGNLYLYCDNDCINYIDVSGHKKQNFGETVLGFIFGGIFKVNVNSKKVINKEEYVKNPIINVTNTVSETITTVHGNTNSNNLTCDINTNPTDWLHSGCGVELQHDNKSAKILLTPMGQYSSLTISNDYSMHTYSSYHDLTSYYISYDTTYISSNGITTVNNWEFEINIGMIVGGVTVTKKIGQKLEELFKGVLIPAFGG